MNTRTRILSTAALEQSLLDMAADSGLELDSMSFIEIEAIRDGVLHDEIGALCTESLNVVFTSVNAVRSIAGNKLGIIPDWKIYCTSGATARAVGEHISATLIHGTAADAGALATMIATDGVKDVVFFCGNKRLDTLPQSLQETGVKVKEVVVYETTEMLQVITKQYDGILFFSPSGVNSFFSINSIPAQTVLFAIGNTTAAAIKEETNNTVVITGTPSKEQVVRYAIQYFENNS